MRGHFKFAAGGVAAMALAITFAIGRSAPPVPLAPEPEEPPFESQWKEAAGPLIFLNAALLPVFKPVELVEPVPVMPQPAPAVVAEPPKEHKKVYADICARHNMRKVKHGRYGWRCRK